ncbi:hypothetical protein KFE80_04995 [bacterium SCSIO 12696]|nr:hypothetical protein KFE80_04995 [bacterium SCSIO 12696]
MADRNCLIRVLRHCFSARLLCPAAILATFACATSADDSQFLPSTLKPSQSKHSTAHPDLDTLCNKGLAERSQQIRSNEMSATHRALNYDWLASHAGEARQYHNGRAFGKIAQKMLRQYWDQKRQQLGDNALLDGNGKIQREFRGIDYGLTTSGGGLNFGLNYTFQ